MKKKTLIVLLSAGHTFDARPLVESIQEHHFEVHNETNCETVSAFKVRDKIIELLKLEEEDLKHISVYPISDFMDEFNNEEVDASSYFMGYVTVSIV